MTMMVKLGFSANDIARLKKFSNEQIWAEIEAREKYGEFTDFTLLGYSVGKLRSFIEHRNELIEEYDSSFAEIHQSFIEDEKSDFFGIELDD